jgi:hypothetical protein
VLVGSCLVSRRRRLEPISMPAEPQSFRSDASAVSVSPKSSPRAGHLRSDGQPATGRASRTTSRSRGHGSSDGRRNSNSGTGRGSPARSTSRDVGGSPVHAVRRGTPGQPPNSSRSSRDVRAYWPERLCSPARTSEPSLRRARNCSRSIGPVELVLLRARGCLSVRLGPVSVRGNDLAPNS